MFRRATIAAAVASAATLTFAQKAPEPVNLVTNASFEEPSITKPTGSLEGGDPSKAPEDKSIWRHFRVRGVQKDGAGGINIGLTNEVARTGKQSIYVDLKDTSGREQRAYLMSDLIPVKAGHKYRVGVWGRIDKKRPLTLDQRRFVMKTEMEFFTPDMDEQAGELEARALMLPGSAKLLHFTSSKWTEAYVEVRVPRTAGWMKVTYRWEPSAEDGTTDGAIYFDDSSAILIPGTEPLVPIDPSELKKKTPDEIEEPVVEEMEEKADAPADKPVAADKPAAPAPPPAPPK